VSGRNLPNIGKEIYPQPHTGAPLKARDVKDWYGVKGDESRLVRCVHCGFICDPDRDMQIKNGNFAGKGVDLGAQQSDTYTFKGKSITDYYYVPTTTGGCPNCGSYNYAGGAR